MYHQGSSIHVFRVNNQGKSRETSSSTLSGLSTRSRTSLSAETKRHICEDHQQLPKMTQEAIAKKYGCKRTTVAKIIKGKERWLAIDPSAAVAKRLRQRNTRYPIIENALLLWLKQQPHPAAVTDQMLQEKARQCAIDFNLDSADEFKASSSWLTNFKQRHNTLKHQHSQEDPTASPPPPSPSSDESDYRSEIQRSQFVFPVVLDPAQPVVHRPPSSPSPSLDTRWTREQLLDYLHSPPSSSDTSSNKSEAREHLEKVLAYYTDIGPAKAPSAQLIQLLLQHDFR